MPDPVQIRVGASIDANLASVIGTVIASAQKARSVVQAEAQAAAAAQGKAFDKAAASGQKAYAAIEAMAAKAAQREQAATDKAAQARVRADMKAFDAKLKATEKAAADFEKTLLKEVAAVEKANARKAASDERAAKASASAEARASKTAGRDRLGIARDAYSTASGVIGGGARMGLGVAKAAGYNLDLSSAVGNVVAQQKLASQISNSGYLEGAEGANGVRQSATAIHHEARQAAKESGLGTDEVLEGLQQMTGKSSDLATSRAILGDMAKLAASTSSSMADVGGAAGEISLKLGDVPDKAKVVSGLMTVIAQQGKTGAIEMREQAKSLGTVMASMQKFGVGPEQAAKDLGVLLQTAKKGGSKNAAAAATGVSSFVAGLTSPTELKRLGQMGINVFDNKGLKKGDAGYNTKIAPLGEIIAASLFKTGGDLGKLGGLFKNVRAMSVVSGFGTIYGDAEKQKKGSGVDAIKKYMADMGKGMSSEDLTASLKEAMSTTASKTQQFNTRMEELGEKLAGNVLPSLEKLEPVALRLADAFVEIAGMAAQNPVEAIVLTIAGSIAKAAIGDVIAKAISGSLAGSLGTSGLIIGTAVVAATTVNLMASENRAKGSTKADEELREGQAATRTAEVKIRKGEKLDPEARAALERRERELRTRVDLATNSEDTFSGRGETGLIGYAKRAAGKIGDAVSSDAGEATGRRSFDKDNLASLIAEMKGVRADLAADRNGTKRVTVDNMPADGLGAPAPQAGPAPL